MELVISILIWGVALILLPSLVIFWQVVKVLASRAEDGASTRGQNAVAVE